MIFETNTVLFGDCREIMRDMIRQCVKVQMCVTSPPYWGLRDYGCNGQLGLERTPEGYVANMVEVFGLVRELLRDDGTLWLVVGDSYSSGKGTCYNPGGGTNSLGKNRKEAGAHPLDRGNKSTLEASGLKPKDLVGIPWMLAFALRSSGWYLRQDNIWSKPNPMPESVTDRCTKSHEYIFLMSKSAKYYYDAEAIKEPSVESYWIRRSDRSKEWQKTYPTEKINGIQGCKSWKGSDFDHSKTGEMMDTRGHKARPSKPKGSFKAKGEPLPGQLPFRAVNEIRNKRSVWTVATKPFSGAHFAVFPPDLISPCILAGSKPGDVVLDPFFGSGTTGWVCEKVGRKWIGIELNQKDYEKISRQRTAQMGMGV